MSGEQRHFIHLTILRRFPWPSLAYMCTKVAYNPIHFISVLDDCCNSLTRKESEDIHVEEEEEEDEVGRIENNELFDFLYIQTYRTCSFRMLRVCFHGLLYLCSSHLANNIQVDCANCMKNFFGKMIISLLLLKQGRCHVVIIMWTSISL